MAAAIGFEVDHFNPVDVPWRCFDKPWHGCQKHLAVQSFLANYTTTMTLTRQTIAALNLVPPYAKFKRLVRS